MTKFVVQNTVSLEMIQDYGIEQIERMLEVDGRRQASAQGVTLPGDYVVERTPLVWVDDWDPSGGAFVNPAHVAIVTGADPVPTHEMVTLAWRVAYPNT